MYPLFETIKIQDGLFQNLVWHQHRFENSYFKLYQCLPKLQIPKALVVPKAFREGKIKCRFRYNRTDFVFSFQHYLPRKVETLKLVYDDIIDYTLKFSDRSQLDLLLQQKGDCDEIIIIKNGLVTDSSYSNLVFYDGHHWVTPAEPLLAGTKRAKLLKEEIINERVILAEDLSGFSKFKLINAMLDFEEQPLIDISAIKK